MDLNRETAMRLWNKQFGKATAVNDFTGRAIRKGAYNDRNSEYGWNVDHILPQSKGGVTADHNLIVCHISTNDEKADKFPCFNANGISFQIVKVENHYEIQQKSETTARSNDTSSEVNFMDSASGIRFFKSLKGIQNKKRFVGTVIVQLKDVTTFAVVDFIEKFFDQENISFDKDPSYYINSKGDVTITAKNYNMPQKDDISALLDKCILLNTYLGHLFLPSEYISSYSILYSIDYFGDKSEMYEDSSAMHCNSYGLAYNSLAINKLVIINTEAEDKLKTYNERGYTEYNYIFTKLAENIEKEVSGR